MSEREDYWFPAKTFGYGWGLPRRWQGWLVLAVYVGALIGCAARFRRATRRWPSASASRWPPDC